MEEEEEGNFLLSIPKKSDKNQRWTRSVASFVVDDDLFLPLGARPTVSRNNASFAVDNDLSAVRAPNGVKEHCLFCCASFAVGNDLSAGRAPNGIKDNAA